MPDLCCASNRDWSPAREARDDNLLAFEEQSTASPAAGIRRSASASGHWTRSTHNDVVLRARRAAYANTLFLSVHGLQGRERHTMRVIRSRSMAAVSMKYGATANLTETKDLLEQAASRPVTSVLLAAVLTACIQGILLGMSISAMNSLEPAVFPGHWLSSWSTAVACFPLGAVVGAGLAPPVSDYLGRKRALVISGSLFAASGVMMATAPCMQVLVVGRFFVGIAGGWAAATIPVYLGEISPVTVSVDRCSQKFVVTDVCTSTNPNYCAVSTQIRGKVGTAFQGAVCIGILFIDALSVTLGAERWRLLLFSTTVLAGLQLVLMMWMPESPAWILSRQNDQDFPQDDVARTKLERARKSIELLHGLHGDDLDFELSYILDAALKQRVAREERPRTLLGLLDVLSDDHAAPLCMHATLLQMSQGLTGAPAVFFYSSSIFAGEHGDADDTDAGLGTILVAAVNLLGVLVSIAFIDNFSRRQLFAVSLGGLLLSATILTAQLRLKLSPIVSIIALVCYAFFFELGVGPLPSIIGVELLQESSLMATSLGIATQMNWATQFFVTLGFPFMMVSLKDFAFMPFIALQIMCLIYVWRALPETSLSNVVESRYDTADENGSSKPRCYLVAPERQQLLPSQVSSTFQGSRSADQHASLRTTTASGAPMLR
eukprot:SAG31_NODE_4174_length_3509_cov_1.547801_1_plen_662_part_00